MSSAGAPQRSALDRAAGQGVVWSMLSHVGGEAIRMGSNLVLTRLLLPEHFGTMLIVNTVILVANLFSDVGIVPSIVQHARGDDPDFLRTAWTIQVGRGVLLAAVIGVVAYPMAHVYTDPQLVPLLQVCAVSVLLQGLTSTSVASYQRHVRLRALATLQISERVVSVVVMTVWAALQPTIWALVAGRVAGTAFTLVASHVALEGPRHRLQLHRGAARDLIRFGRWVFLSTLAMCVAGYSDRLLVSKLMSRDVAGVYGIAVSLAAIPTTGLSVLYQKVGFPVLSRVASDRNRLLETFGKVRDPLSSIAGWVVALLFAGAPVGVQLLWPIAYWEAGRMVQIILLGVWLGGILVYPYNAALLARGAAHTLAVASFVKLIGLVVLVPAGFLLAGLPGLIAGYSVSELCRYCVITWAIGRIGIHEMRGDLRSTLFLGVSGGLGLAVSYTCYELALPLVVNALLVGAVVTACWSAQIFEIAVRLRRERTIFASLGGWEERPEAAAPRNPLGPSAPHTAPADDAVQRGDDSAASPAGDAAPCRIALVTVLDPGLHSTWSGIPYFTRAALERGGAQVAAIGPLSPSLETLLARRVARRIGLRGLEYGYSRHTSSFLARQARARLRDVPHDVVFALAASPVAGEMDSNVPLIYCSDATFRLLRDYYPEGRSLPRFVARRFDALEAAAIARADALVYPSEWAATSAVEDYGADPAKVTVIPFGANLASPPRRDAVSLVRPDGPLRVLSVGVDWVRKGCDVAVDACRVLRERGHDVRLTVVGCIPPREVEESFVTVIPYLDKSHPVESLELAALYREAHVFLLPTRAECYGIVFCEASAYGVPIVAPRTGGVASVVVDGVNGHLVEAESGPETYATAIEELIADPARYVALRVSARDHYERTLNWDAWTARFLEVVRGTLASAPPDPRRPVPAGAIRP